MDDDADDGDDDINGMWEGGGADSGSSPASLRGG